MFEPDGRNSIQYVGHLTVQVVRGFFIVLGICLAGVYAATSPDARIWRIGHDGRTECATEVALERPPGRGGC